MRRVVPEQLPLLDPAPHDAANCGSVVLTLAEVGRIARWWRTRQRRSLRDAAGILGVTQRLLAELERGERGVRLDKALDLLAGMGFDFVLVPRDPTMSLQFPTKSKRRDEQVASPDHLPRPPTCWHAVGRKRSNSVRVPQMLSAIAAPP